MDAALPAIREAAGPNAGLVGFSQGGAAAVLAADASTPWLALFSAVTPQVAWSDAISSVRCFNSYDPEEEFVSQCIEVASSFKDKEVHIHHGGHVVPQDAHIVAHFVSFVQRHQHPDP